MKKNNSLKIVVIVVSVVLLLGLGATGMYFYLTKIGTTTIINKSEKEVTVTDSGIADAVEKVIDSVVIVEVYQNNKLYGTGSGFIFERDNDVYYVMTNNHVVTEATTVKIVLSNGTSIETTLIGSDQYLDIAVLSFKSSDELSVATIGSSSNMRIGDTVFTVGAPIDSTTYSWSVTRGVLSGKDRMVSVSTSNSSVADYIMKSLQTDATINAGNSGGPLCNSNGEVIGITNMKLVSSSSTTVEGMSFAIPIEDAIEYAQKLLNGEDVSRPSIGIKMAEISQSNILYYYYDIKIPSNVEEGVVVVSTIKGSAAEKSGLEAGDVITKVNDTDVSSMAELKYELYKYNVGETIKLTVNRKGKTITIDVTLEKSE